ncbi:MAG TPA: EsaB/YukD family protein [Streptosporangiaceae bacterium]
MADRNCRVTVIGTASRADVAVPARAPIGQYAASLALLCSEPDSDVMPAAWTLATPEAGTLPPTSSLTECGIVDGQVLYLRDRAAGEYDEPGVFEVHELVAEAAGRAGGPRWDTSARTAAMLIAGAVWLVAVVTALVFTGVRASAGPLAAGAGLALALTAWVARGSRLAIPAAVRALLTLGALPCLGVAGWFVGMARSGGQPGPGIAGLSAGVLAGALIGLLAMPSVAAFAAAVTTAAAAAIVTALVMLHAGLAGTSAVVALLSYVMVILVPRAAGRLAALWALLTGHEDPEVTVVWARHLLAAGNILACAVLAVAVVLLADSPSPFAIALALSLSLAVLLHTRACSFVAEAGPAVAAGLAGLLSVLLFATGRLLTPPAWTVPVAGAGLGVAVLAAGLALSMGSPGRTAGETAWSRMIASACLLAAVPLAVGVFGVFGTLLHLGRHM